MCASFFDLHMLANISLTAVLPVFLRYLGINKPTRSTKLTLRHRAYLLGWLTFANLVDQQYRPMSNQKAEDSKRGITYKILAIMIRGKLGRYA